MINTFGDTAKYGVALSVNPEGEKYRKSRRRAGIFWAPRRVNKKAFLLFEVTLTIAVLSFGLVFVVRSISASMKAARTASLYNEAINLAYEKMFDLELESQIQGLKPAFSEGVFSRNQHFNWKYSIEQFDGSSLGRLVLNISWKEGKREGGFDVATYVRIKE